jgi:hypothetical protein
MKPSILNPKLIAEIKLLARRGLSQSAITRRLQSAGIPISRPTVLRVLNPAARARHRAANRVANRRDRTGGLDERYL